MRKAWRRVSRGTHLCRGRLNLTTGTFADYLMPNVYNMPPVRTLVLEEAKAPGNVLGVKGVGEVGPSGVAAAVGNAIADALGASSGLNRLPLTPERVLQATGFASAP
ncbi:MAG: hypothetical protein R3E51_17200 [Rhizobiaceae bacterium]